VHRSGGQGLVKQQRKVEGANPRARAEETQIGNGGFFLMAATVICCVLSRKSCVRVTCSAANEKAVLNSTES
jgi:hypothetical protein